jgi:hypothetical protein
MSRLRLGRRPALDDALHGALAGLIGGAALLAVQRLVLPRLAGSRRRVRNTWDDRFDDAVTRLGWKIPPGSRAAVSAATQLLYAALLGAAYGVARRPLVRSPNGQRFLDAGLLLAASVFSADLPPGPRPRGRRSRIARLAREQAAAGMNAPMLYHRATAIALDRLSR